MRKALQSDAIPSTSLPFSPAVWAGDVLYLSGQASVSDTGEYIEDDFAGERDRSMSNVERILAAAGLTLDDVVRVAAYLADGKYRDEFNERYTTYFGAPFPARTTTICGLAGLKVEIDVVAHRSARIPG